MDVGEVPPALLLLLLQTRSVHLTLGGILGAVGACRAVVQGEESGSRGDRSFLCRQRCRCIPLSSTWVFYSM